MRRPLCTHAGPTPPAGGRDRTCALGLHGGTVQRLGACATCASHSARTGATAKVELPVLRDPCAHEGNVLETCHTCKGADESRHVRECAKHDTKCTRAVVSDKVRACATCPDHVPEPSDATRSAAGG